MSSFPEVRPNPLRCPRRRVKGMEEGMEGRMSWAGGEVGVGGCAGGAYRSQACVDRQCLAYSIWKASSCCFSVYYIIGAMFMWSVRHVVR